MTTIIACDPGASGGLAWNSQGEGVQACGMPREEEAVVELLRSIIQANAGNRIVAYVELVTGYISKPHGEACPACGQPKEKAEPGSRMFTFGRGVGVLVGALRMAGIEPKEVSPRTWQKPFYVNLYKPSAQRKSRSERKRILRDIAQRRFMGLEVTLKTADALLIHAYGTMMESQELDLDEAKPLYAPLAFTKTHSKGFRELMEAVAATPVPGNGKDDLTGRKTGDQSAGALPRSDTDQHDQHPASLTQFDSERPDFPVPGGPNLYLCDWKGTPWVVQRTEGGPDLLLHKADPHDLATLNREELI